MKNAKDNIFLLIFISSASYLFFLINKFFEKVPLKCIAIFRMFKAYNLEQYAEEHTLDGSLYEVTNQ